MCIRDSCCEVLKERGGEGCFTVTGVRWQESSKRMERNFVEILGKNEKNKKMIYLNCDNEEVRRQVEVCQLKGKRVLNPIIDWTEDEAVSYTHLGEVVRRNPETVILLTTNMGYRGCKGFNESVLSRMRMVLYSDPLTSEEMVYRIQKKITVLEPGMLKKMADAVCAIQKHCRTCLLYTSRCV